MNGVAWAGILLAAGTAAAGNGEPPAIPARLQAALGSVSPDSILADVAFLADDARGGRAPGTPGDEATTAFLADRLHALGLEPLGPDGSFLQPVPMHGIRPQPGTVLTIHPPDGGVPIDLGIERDFLVYSAPTDVIPRPVPLVFVGYGIVAPEFDHDDYAALDVAGAIVVFLSGEPPSADPAFFAGDEPTVYSTAEFKQRVAIARGAVGSILLPRWTDFPYRDWTRWTSLFAFEHVTAPWDIPRNLSVLLAADRADVLFRGGRVSFDDVQRLDGEGRLSGFPLESRATFRGRFARRDFASDNVIGRLPGSEPLLRDECVLVVAHHDHLGTGPEIRGDAIYNGAVDNALGCAGALEIARVLASLDPPPARSTVFLFTAGEEKGLLGARYYAAHPAVPLHRTIAALNVDGLAIFDTFRSVTGIGADLSTLGRHLESVAGELDVRIVPIPPFFRSEEALVSSDHLALAEAGIPSMLVMEGLEYDHLPEIEGIQTFIAWGQLRYHTPFDDLEQPMNRDAIAQHARLLLAVTGALGETARPPQWLAATPYVNARLQSIAEGR